MKRNKIVAITGGIGSGKSTVLSIVKELGGITASADEFNRVLLADRSYLEGLEKLFPTAFVDGNLDRSVLRNLVFSDTEKLKKLNEYAHSSIWKKIEEFIVERDENVFIEIPLLTGEDFHIGLFDKIWVTISSSSIKRAAIRDNVSEESITSIAHNQISDDDRGKIATDTIINDGDFFELKNRVEELYFSLNER